MKLLVLTTNIDRPSTRYRILQYIPYLKREGIGVETFVVRKDIDKWKAFNKAKKYAGVFIQKKLFSKMELFYLQKTAKKIIYDYDDAVMYGAHSANAVLTTKRYRRFNAAINTADLIIAGNQYLASQIKDICPGEIIIIPTVIQTTLYPVKEYKDNHPVTLGWIGTSSTIGYLNAVLPVIDRLSKKYSGICLKVISDRKPDFNGEYLKYHKWNEQEECKELVSLDIGLMPLPDTPWTRGKCGFKLLQYMASGLASVSSPVGVNADIVRNCVNGFLAGTNNQWEESLRQLIENNNLRKQMGQKGRSFAEKHYNLESWGPFMAGRIKQILRK